MTQESHQMGLDTRENATPVTYDTGDTGVTSPAEPEWGGNARGPPAVPLSPVRLPLPNMLKATTGTRHFPETPQPQKLQDDTGILPFLHACRKLCRKSKAGESGSRRKQRKGALNWFLQQQLHRATKKQGGGAHKVLPMGKDSITSAKLFPERYSPKISCSFAWPPLPWSCRSC